ncbi:unnamed protein product [Citrullus colocynthis]|uniref:Uncharacterized protein n=1 Tax=Citrullus colocynthis TaxID=252529 RepID=A0ABP0Y5Y3_9ROSI
MIDEACGGLLDIDYNTRRKFDLTKAKLKIRYNYCGSNPAEIKIILEDQTYKVYTVPPAKGKWLTGKHPRIYDTFSREAVANFDNCDPNAETFLFHDGVARAAQHIKPTNCKKTKL